MFSNSQTCLLSFNTLCLWQSCIVLCLRSMDFKRSKPGRYLFPWKKYLPFLRSLHLNMLKCEKQAICLIIIPTSISLHLRREVFFTIQLLTDSWSHTSCAVCCFYYFFNSLLSCTVWQHAEQVPAKWGIICHRLNCMSIMF